MANLHFTINVCVLLGFDVVYNYLSVISPLSGCDRELIAHFYSIASLRYHVPDN